MVRADPLKLSVRTVLAEMDVNSDGYVSRSEMREALKRMGRNLDDSDIDAVFDSIDKDSSGRITFEGS
ncbi:unnamed protein product [Soboliphyme baturini]|uniref:EF-hand domain-containing protein n=1 Tax=Soboliphyme baturini TaxID=241478 RepID=A0A183IFY6_9BILA|nr:unnamed protein product [Soboliphyme baturini]